MSPKPLASPDGYWRRPGEVAWRPIRSQPPPAPPEVLEWLDHNPWLGHLGRNEAAHEHEDRVRWSVPMPDRRGPQAP